MNRRADLQNLLAKEFDTTLNNFDTGIVGVHSWMNSPVPEPAYDPFNA